MLVNVEKTLTELEVVTAVLNDLGDLNKPLLEEPGENFLEVQRVFKLAWFRTQAQGIEEAATAILEENSRAVANHKNTLIAFWLIGRTRTCTDVGVLSIDPSESVR